MFFPEIEASTGVKGIMNTSLEQHKTFESGFKALESYVKDVTPATYDGEEVRRLTNLFGNVLSVHLTSEIDSLLELDKYGGEKLLQTWNAFEKKMQKMPMDKVCFILLLRFPFYKAHGICRKEIRR
jgi:hypothetical protein